MKIQLRWVGLGIIAIIAVACGSSGGKGGTGGAGGTGAKDSTATYVICGSSMDPIYQPDGCPEGTANECCLPDGCCCECPTDWTSSGAGVGSSGAGGGPADAGAD